MKIVAVDDSKSILGFIGSILEKKYDAVLCNDSSQAEAEILANSPDLILLDIVMPEKSGYEILRKVKRNPTTKHIPVVLVSSKKEETDINWGKKQGADDYLAKPFTEEELLAKVARFANRETEATPVAAG